MVRFKLILLALCALAGLLLGCGSLKMRSDPPQPTIKFAPAGRGQIYKVPIMLTQAPPTALGQRLGKLYLESLVRTIGHANPRIELLTPTDADFPAFMASLPAAASGGDSFAAMEAARRLGVQGVILAAVGNLRTNTRNWGFMWLRRTNYFLSFSVTLDLYDPFTGAKLVSRLQERVLKIDADDYEGIQDGSLSAIEALEETLTDDAAESGKLVAAQLGRQPWKATVAAVQPGVIQLSAGSGAALQPDQKLGIYEARRTIQNRYNQKFIVPGVKIAEARISRVEGGLVEAVLEDSAAVTPGDLAVLIP